MLGNELGMAYIVLDSDCDPICLLILFGSTPALEKGWTGAIGYGVGNNRLNWFENLTIQTWSYRGTIA